MSTWNNKKPKIAIGIDPGTKTGIGIYDADAKKLTDVITLPIHKAMDMVKGVWFRNPTNVIVRFEDARQATFGRANDMHRAQGAGSVKRDCSIWEDFLKDLGVEYEAVRPRKAITKLDKETFTKITGYTGLTSNHSRDAAMLVYGL